jgi:hypothetical protein
MPTKMVVMIDCEYLDGSHNEPFVKELPIAAKDVMPTFHFESPYAMRRTWVRSKRTEMG